MGLFGSNSTTYVSSVVYNMAGDVNKRPNFLKSTVAGAVIGGDPTQSVADVLKNAYQSGPGMSYRSFYRWASGSSGYNSTVGFVSGSLVTGNSLNTQTLAAQIQTALGAPDGYTVAIQSNDIGYADISWWAEQYILENNPSLINTNWHCDYLNGQGVITYADSSTASFTPAGFNPEGKYIFAAYTLNTGQSAGTVVTGSVVNLDALTAFPDTTGWTLDSNTMTPVTLNLSSVTIQGMDTTSVFEMTTYLGIDPANPKRTHSTRQIMMQVQTVSVVNGAMVTTRWYRIDTQDITNYTQSALQIYIYPQGSGNATLDAMFNPPGSMGSFFPYIPIRINNQMVSASYEPDVYAMAKKAYYRLTSRQFDDLVTQINSNASIGDIDYAYMVFGVSVNVAEVAAKKYIFSFFESIMDSASFTHHAYSQFKTQWAAAEQAQQAYDTWVQNNGGYGSSGSAPAVPTFPTMPAQSIQIRTDTSSNINYNMLISWNGVESSFGAGMVDPAHAVGDIWWVINGADTFNQSFGTLSSGTSFSESYQISNVTLYWQVDSNNWKALNIYGLLHQNFIYGGKSVDTAITDAINDTSESGFIIPLHEQIFQSMPLIDATQMATANTYLVFNCYQVVKKKWYQTGLFAVIMIIIIIIITIVTWGQGTGPAVTFYASLGAAVGFTGTAAIIAGLAISLVASMILMQVLGYVATKLFGAKVGAIVKTIAAVVMIVFSAYEMGGGDWTTALNSLTSPQNILSITNAVAGGITQYMGAETQDIIGQTQTMTDQYNASMKSVSDMYASVLGSDPAMFDPLQLTSDPAAVTGVTHTYEPPDTFLNRTLMTGSDISELDSALITQFTSLTLDLNQNLVT